jgi:hypothetical protein
MWKVGGAFVVGLVIGLVPWARSTSFALDAIRSGSYPRLWLYLVLGGDANARTPAGSLLYAVMDLSSGQRAAIEQATLLAHHGADIEGGPGTDTPLMAAAAWCNPDAITALLQLGANRNAVRTNGRTAASAVCVGPPDARSKTLRALGVP